MREIQRHAALTLARVFDGRSLDAALSDAFKQLDQPADRAALQNICYGALRHYGQLDAILAALADRPLQSHELRCLLIAGLFQLQYTRAAPHAVVDHAVSTCLSLRQRGAQGLVNAILRRFLREREALLKIAAATEVGRFSHPQWWIDRLRVEYPDDYRAILEAGNLHPPMCLRVNRRKANRDDYLARLNAANLEAEVVDADALLLKHPLAVDALPGFRDGLVSVQDAGAQHAARALDVDDGQRVLDAFSAPGGKAAHILELADIELIALDVDPKRLTRVRENLDRLNLAAQLSCADAANLNDWWDGRGFDRVLADVPCSASGVVRRHPDAKWLRRETDIAQFAQCQSGLLDALWRALVPDGKLLYATCSVFNDENERQIADFVDRHDDAQRAPLDLPDHGNGQLLPNPRHDGFFYALLRKR